MKLPKIFKEDIQSKNVQLIPLLIIERDSGLGDFSYDSNSIFLSTHDINIQKSEEGLPYPDTSYEDGMYFSPLLLDNPVITEKIDVENRKYTISKCTFKISNHSYNGERFSDMLNADSLIGKKVNFSYKSINSSLPISSYFVYESTDISFSDAYESYDYCSPTFYFGEIRDIKHNNEVVTITAEDLGSTYLHQQVPRNSLKNNTSINPHYRNAKIPMVYGYMPKSPLVMGANKRLYADSRPISGWFQNNLQHSGRYSYPFASADFGAVFISINDNYCCVSNTIEAILPETKDILGNNLMSQQIEYIDDDTYDTEVAKFIQNPLLSRKLIQVYVVYKPSSISLERRNDQSVWDVWEEETPLTFGDGDTGWGEDTDVDSNGLATGGDQLTETEFEYMTDNDFSSTHELASNDLHFAQSSEAMIIHEDYYDQLIYNQFKHSLFRFVISTEPPIGYFSRGGTGSMPLFLGSTSHWIAFGHWVMPDQSWIDEEESHHLYTWAKDDDTSWFIDKRVIDPVDNDPDDEIGQAGRYYTGHPPTYEHYDTWGRATYLADIIRFSDYHTNTEHGENNPEQINWQNYEVGGKSPLELFGLEIADQTGGTFPYEYTNPYAKFSKHSNEGKYIVELGSCGASLSTQIGTGYHEVWDGLHDSHGYNFNYTGRMSGWLPEVTCMSVCDVSTNFKDMYGSVLGRLSGTDLITHPSDIIADIFVNELGYDSSSIDQESLDATKGDHAHEDWSFSFAQAEEINSKDLIEDIAKSTFIFPRIGFDGMLKFPQIKLKYNQTDLDNSILIEDLDVISYKYNLTKRQELITATHMKYDYDHQSNNYFGDKDTKIPYATELSQNVTGMVTVSDEEASYNGIDNIDDNIKEFKSKYLRSSIDTEMNINTANPYIDTIRSFQTRNTHHYRNRHLIIKCKLPLKYLNIEVGDYVRFNKLIDEVKAYGIDYTKLVEKNNQYLYPLFMCTVIKKSIEYVELELLQLHHLMFADTIVGLANPDSIWNDIGEEQISSIYYDDIGLYAPIEEDEEDDEPDEPVDPDALVDSIIILPSSETLYNYDTFNLVEGETEYPYGIFLGDQLLYMQGGSAEENYFGDPNTGIHKLFSPEHFKVQLSSGGEFVPVGNWNDLLPGNFTTTDASNQNYTIFEINHSSSTFNYTYKLKNMQPNIGDPIQIEWELTVNQADSNFEGGQILAAPYNNLLFSGHEFVINNRSIFAVSYDSPHPMVVSEISQEEDLVLGDFNGDGFVDILDAVSTVNLILSYPSGSSSIIEELHPNLDMNGDGNVNILDIMIIMQTIMGNE